MKKENAADVLMNYAQKNGWKKESDFGGPCYKDTKGRFFGFFSFNEWCFVNTWPNKPRISIKTWKQHKTTIEITP